MKEIRDKTKTKEREKINNNGKYNIKKGRDNNNIR